MPNKGPSLAQWQIIANSLVDLMQLEDRRGRWRLGRSVRFGLHSSFKTSVGERHYISVSQSIVRTSASETHEELIRNASLYQSGSLVPRGQPLGSPPPPDHPLSLDASVF